VTAKANKLANKVLNYITSRGGHIVDSFDSITFVGYHRTQYTDLPSALLVADKAHRTLKVSG
jgi:hypothetical protein